MTLTHPPTINQLSGTSGLVPRLISLSALRGNAETEKGSGII